jgi:hypothetical protein
MAKSINSVFWGNSYSQIALDTYMNLGGNLSFEYSNVQGGEDLIDVSPESTLTWLEGNMNQDPCFVGSGDHDCQINDDSPCINTGTPDTTGLNLPEYDLAGEVRIFNDRIDMGAYEWNTFVGGLDVRSLKFDVECYPNPFTTSTTIEYELKQPENVVITFYNQFGEKVDAIQRWQPAGVHLTGWAPVNLAPGIYYFSLQVRDQVNSGKLVKIGDQ